MKRKGEKILKPVRPNAGIAAEYRAKLDALIEEMTRSYVYFLKAQYRQSPPKMAMDDLPARELERELRRLGIRWERRFNESAPKLAKWFATAASKRSTAGLKKILKDSGIAVEFKMTPAMKDIFEATVAENVGLIKTISQEYHGQVQGLVMRSVQAGHDLGFLARELEKRYGISKRRAAFIATDQNNKCTAVFTRVRQKEAGITKCIWLHSLGGKEPRKTHLANNGKTYNPEIGWLDPDPKINRRIWPGELPRCRCVSRSVVKGFE